MAQAVLARGGHALPDLGVFGYLRQIAPVAGLGDAGEHLDLAQLRDLGTRFQGALVALHAVQVIVADIVAAPPSSAAVTGAASAAHARRSRENNWSCSVRVPVEISTLPPWMKRVQGRPRSCRCRCRPRRRAWRGPGWPGRWPAPARSARGAACSRAWPRPAAVLGEEFGYVQVSIDAAWRWPRPRPDRRRSAVLAQTRVWGKDQMIPGAARFWLLHS